MRMLNFPQWIDLLKDIFSKFTVFLQRVKVSLHISCLEYLKFSQLSGQCSELKYIWVRVSFYVHNDIFGPWF
jgi:hypothetical protein